MIKSSLCGTEPSSFTELKSRVECVLRLLKELVCARVPLSVESFDAVLQACVEAKKLTSAVNTYKCMTRDYEIVPTRKVWNIG